MGNEERNLVLVQWWLYINIKSGCCTFMVGNSYILIEKLTFRSQKNVG